MIYRESYIKELQAFKDKKIIKVITGLRRSGKSTLLKMFIDKLLKEGVNQNQIQYLNFELMKYDSIRDYKALYNLLRDMFIEGKKNYLFLDEIQQVNGWEKTVNSLMLEYDVDIYITGSNAYLLSSELATLIAGRYVEIKMLPLSFKEYYSYFHSLSSKGKDELFIDYLKYGGLPQLLELAQNEETINLYLSSIYDTIILKDVLERNKLKDIDLLKRIFSFLCDNVGSITSANNIANYISHESKLDKSMRPANVSNIISMLENAFIIARCGRYDIKGKEILKSLEKYYVADTGLKNIMSGYTLKNYGHTIENILYLELIRRGYKVYVGKNQTKEIDFVAINKSETRYFQIAETILNEETLKREITPLINTNDFYEKTIITMDKTFATNIKGIKIINLIDFLLS